MSSIYIMIGASLLIAGGFLIAFIWAVKNKQYDDTYGDSIRPLFDNDLDQPLNQTQNSTTVSKKKQ